MTSRNAGIVIHFGGLSLMVPALLPVTRMLVDIPPACAEVAAGGASADGRSDMVVSQGPVPDPWCRAEVNGSDRTGRAQFTA